MAVRIVEGCGRFDFPWGTAAEGIFAFVDQNQEGPPVVALDAEDGSTRWKDDTLRGCKFVDGTLYGAAEPFDLAAVDVDSGEPKWTRNYPCGGFYAEVVDDVRITLCRQGLLRLDEDYEVVWQYDARPRGPVVPLGAADGKLFLLENIKWADDA